MTACWFFFSQCCCCFCCCCCCCCCCCWLIRFPVYFKLHLVSLLLICYEAEFLLLLFPVFPPFLSSLLSKWGVTTGYLVMYYWPYTSSPSLENSFWPMLFHALLPRAVLLSMGSRNFLYYVFFFFLFFLRWTVILFPLPASELHVCGLGGCLLPANFNAWVNTNKSTSLDGCTNVLGLERLADRWKELVQADNTSSSSPS